MEKVFYNVLSCVLASRYLPKLGFIEIYMQFKELYEKFNPRI